MKRSLFLLGLLGVVALAPARPGTSQEPPKPPDLLAYNPTNHHHYQVVRVEENLTWPQTAAIAAGRTFRGARGHLVTITDPAEQKFLESNLYAPDSWTGAFQDRSAPDYREPGGGWRWVTGEPWQFAGWNEGEPNNGSPAEEFVLFTSNGRWNDFGHGKTTAQRYIVEYPTTGPSTNPPVSASNQIDQLLARVQKRYRGLRSYSARVQFSFKAHIDTLGAINTQLVLQYPGRFRLEGRGNNGSLLAVSDGRFFAMARTRPGEKMQYMVKRSEGLQSLREALSLLIEAPLPPSITDFILSATPPRLWSTGGRIGWLHEEAPREQQIRSNVRMQFLGEDPIDADAELIVSLDDPEVRSSEISFRYKAFPFTARETHSEIRVNGPVPAAAFAFQPTPGAIEVDDLGERTDEVSYSPGRRP